jgi:hypothetical protein
MREDQFAACPITGALLEAWAMTADAHEPLIRPGQVNWVMMVRSLIAEIHRLQGLAPVVVQ